VVNSLAFPELLRCIDERSAAFHDAVRSAPSLDAPVPGCPEWTLFDLAHHLGAVRRTWAAVVATGSRPEVLPAPQRATLLDWLGESARGLVDALREAGPDRECATWWGDSQSPQTSGAIARHQVQEVTVHTYDAQLTAGTAPPLPERIALDGVEEFLTTCCATTHPWPYEPATVDYHAVEGRSWRLSLSARGVRADRVDGTEPATVDASLRGTASDLVLVLYGRIPMESVKLDGDRRHLDRLFAWDPEE
jgi:uncharacterized protein (TIGR03083 family)